VWGIHDIQKSDIVDIAVHPHVCGEYAVAVVEVRQKRVHPHVCGEYISTFVEETEACGSPIMDPKIWTRKNGIAVL
jgi:hypothetical protein